MNSIVTNIPAAAAQRSFVNASVAARTATTRLATGLRINAGRDDPAGLIASENLRAVLARLEAESRSIERAEAYSRSADAVLSETAGLAARGAAIEVAEASTGGMSEAEAAAYRMERASIEQAIDRAFDSAWVGDRAVFDGRQTLRAGGESYAIPRMSAGEAGIEPGGANFREAIGRIASVRGELGAFTKNAIETQRTQLAVERENVTAAESVIRDADFAAEASALNRAQALGAASLFAGATANARPQAVLNLLIGGPASSGPGAGTGIPTGRSPPGA